MSERSIDDIIQIAEQREPDAYGSNKKCFLIDEYALLRQNFIIDQLDRMMYITEELKQKGINVVRTLDYKVIEQENQTKDKKFVEKYGNYLEGYVLQERAKGKPLVNESNMKKDRGKVQIDYLKQIDSIAQ